MERRDFIIAGLIWLAVTLASFAVIFFLMDPFPTKGSEEAEIIDEAFAVLSYMAAPVFGFVIAALAYSLLRFRAHGMPAEDGPAILGTNWVPKAWLGATAALAVVVMIYPGLTGLADLRSDNNADLEIEIVAFQWSWLATYPESGARVSAATGELVLPEDTRIRFSITSQDVLHSFWVPALGPKIDAVPGIETELFITTKGPGSRDTDFAGYRLQCAELCGLRHSAMVMDVRVVTREEFEQFLAGAERPADGDRAENVVAVSLSEWAVVPDPTSTAAGPLTFAASNDGAVTHELVVIRTDLPVDELPTDGGVVDESAVEFLGRTRNLLAAESEDVNLDLPSGSYALICNIPGHYQLGMRTGFTIE